MNYKNPNGNNFEFTFYDCESLEKIRSNYRSATMDVSDCYGYVENYEWNIGYTGTYTGYCNSSGLREKGTFVYNPDEGLNETVFEGVFEGDRTGFGRLHFDDGTSYFGNWVHEKENGENVLSLIQKNLVLSAHDISSGGLLVSLSEMSIASKLGVKIQKPKKLTNLNEYFFGEDQSRYLLEISEDHLTKVEKNLKKNNIFYELIGKTQKRYFEIENEIKLDVNYLSKINNQWYYNY